MLAFCSNNFGQNNKSINYKIEIIRSGLLMDGNCYWTITYDSIKIKKENIDNATDIYSKTLASAERLIIIDALKKVRLKKMKSKYVDNSAADDAGEYEFEISFNGQTKWFRVYQVKLKNIFYLVKVINELIPNRYQIGYNDRYFDY